MSGVIFSTNQSETCVKSEKVYQVLLTLSSFRVDLIIAINVRSNWYNITDSKWVFSTYFDFLHWLTKPD
jgi:hypothetical protein